MLSRGSTASTETCEPTCKGSDHLDMRMHDLNFTEGHREEDLGYFACDTFDV
jgi:hypothetical protein